MSYRKLWAGVIAICLVAVAADAARLPGTFSNADTGIERALRFRGRADTGTGTLRGRVRCGRSCPVRGPLQTTCTPGGNATSWECSGTVGTCTVEGYFYQVTTSRYFEATYECSGGTVGSFALGRR